MNSQRPQHMRPSAHATRQLRHRSTPIVATICALAVVLAGVAAYGWHVGWFAKSTSNGNTTTPQTSQTSALPRADVPSPKKNEPAAQAQRAVSAMTLEERVGQLVMVPLLAGSDPSSLASTTPMSTLARPFSLAIGIPAPIRSRPRPRNSKDMRRPAIVSSSPPIRRVVRCSI